jgi:hypothetical protein
VAGAVVGAVGAGAAFSAASIADVLLIVVAGLPWYGALYAPASALVASGAEPLGLNQGIAFAVSNLAWAAGQAVASSASGALAQATSDVVPYALLAVALVGTAVALRGSGRASASPGRPGPSPGRGPGPAVGEGGGDLPPLAAGPGNQYRWAPLAALRLSRYDLTAG